MCLCVFAIERKRCLLCVPETGEIRTDHLGLLVYRPSPKQKSPVTPHPELINLLIRRNTAQTKSTETNFLLRNHRESNASPRHCEYLTFFVIFFHTIRYLLTCFFIGVNTRFSHPPGLRSPNNRILSFVRSRWEFSRRRLVKPQCGTTAHNMAVIPIEMITKTRLQILRSCGCLMCVCVCVKGRVG